MVPVEKFPFDIECQKKKKKIRTQRQKEMGPVCIYNHFCIDSMEGPRDNLCYPSESSSILNQFAWNVAYMLQNHLSRLWKPFWNHMYLICFMYGCKRQWGTWEIAFKYVKVNGQWKCRYHTGSLGRHKGKGCWGISEKKQRSSFLN